MEIPGLNEVLVSNGDSNVSTLKCDVIESRPVFLLSNDDIYNLGHFSNDLMGIWSMIMMSGRCLFIYIF
jgi:hypothetical protein